MANRKLLLLSVRLFGKKTLWERFQNTVGAISKHCGSDLKTQWEKNKNTEGAQNRSINSNLSA